MRANLDGGAARPARKKKQGRRVLYYAFQAHAPIHFNSVAVLSISSEHLRGRGCDQGPLVEEAASAAASSSKQEHIETSRAPCSRHHAARRDGGQGAGIPVTPMDVGGGRR